MSDGLYIYYTCKDCGKKYVRSKGSISIRLV